MAPPEHKHSRVRRLVADRKQAEDKRPEGAIRGRRIVRVRIRRVIIRKAYRNTKTETNEHARLGRNGRQHRGAKPENNNKYRGADDANPSSPWLDAHLAPRSLRSRQATQILIPFRGICGNREERAAVNRAMRGGGCRSLGWRPLRAYQKVKRFVRFKSLRPGRGRLHQVVLRR